MWLDHIKKEFNKKGYVRVGFFSPFMELLKFRELLEKSIPRTKDLSIDRRFIEADKKDHSTIHRLYNMLKNSEPILNMTFDESFIRDAKFLMGLSTPDSLYVPYHVCRMDPPEDERFTYRWHQESFYSIFGADQVQIWMPLLHGSTKENGTMSVLVGSHKDGEIPHFLHKTEGGHEQKYIPMPSSKHKEEFIKLNPGEAILFHKHLIHRSNYNVSDKVRFTLVAAYVNPLDEKFHLEDEATIAAYHRSRCMNA